MYDSLTMRPCSRQSCWPGLPQPECIGSDSIPHTPPLQVQHSSRSAPRPALRLQTPGWAAPPRSRYKTGTTSCKVSTSAHSQQVVRLHSSLAPCSSKCDPKGLHSCTSASAVARKQMVRRQSGDMTRTAATAGALCDAAGAADDGAGRAAAAAAGAQHDGVGARRRVPPLGGAGQAHRAAAPHTGARPWPSMSVSSCANLLEPAWLVGEQDSGTCVTQTVYLAQLKACWPGH
jgi:hypothetical protein